jgi:putative metallohydrolase (TIGR04338 family)
MQQQDPRVDRYRGAVYQAEDTIASVMARPHRTVRIDREVVTLPEPGRFGSLSAVQAFVDAVLADPRTTARYPGRGPVRVEAKRGYRSATYSEGSIRIPAADPRGRWALTRAVVLHEVAHHLAGVPGHGRGFREVLVHLYADHLGAGAAALLAHLLAPLDAVPDPGAGEQDADTGQVRRVAALLAKAQSTASAEEAEAYLAKAALVAQRHRVDLALAATRPGAQAGPTHRMLTIGEPRRALNKILVGLFLEIARAWSVRVDIGHGSTYVLAYGMPADLDQVESVFATASTLMLTRALEHVRSDRWRGTSYVPPGSRTPRPVTAAVARNAFCLGFIQRLGQRLASAAEQARAAAAAAGTTAGGGSTGPARGRTTVDLALRAREVAVRDYHQQVSRARGAWRGSASAAGSATVSRRAGERAAEEYGRRGIPGGRRAIEG